MPQESRLVEQFDSLAEQMRAELKRIQTANPGSERSAAIALHFLETACMWANRAGSRATALPDPLTPADKEALK